MQPEIFLVSAGLVAATAWLGVPSLFRRWSSNRLLQIATRHRAIVLTYDDGPSQSLTPDLLDLLQRRGVHATFYLIGREAVQRTSMAQRLHEDGHEIGNHTQDHLNAWRTGPLRGLHDMQAGKRQLADLGASVQSFRPPFGESTLLTLLHSLLRGPRIAFWTNDSRDSWDRLPIEKVLKQIDEAGGAVLPMHDFDRPRRGPSPDLHQKHVLKLTESVIDFAEQNDFGFMRFSDLFIASRLGPTGGKA